MSIISIQSHVVYGYVGNKAATFPLQSMGIDVWPINTVQFSNHTGYGKWEGMVFDRTHIRNIIQGIENLGVTNKCAAIISGYMGSGDICHEVFDIVKKFKAKNANLLYLCDPVIGKVNCFVKPEVLEFFKTYLQADIITPSHFEAETFSGIPIKNFMDLKKASDHLHNMGNKIVIITGIKVQEIAPETGVFISYDDHDYLIKTKKYNFAIYPNGTGDLFSALFLGNYLKVKNPIAALKRAVYFVDLVMKNTYQYGSRELLVTSVNYADLEEKHLPDCIKL